MNNIYTINHKDIQFVKNGGYDLITNHDKTDGNSTDQGYFSILDDYFDRTLAANQIGYISSKIIPQKLSLPITNKSSNNMINKSRVKSDILSP